MKEINIGKMDKRISIVEYQDVPDGLGQTAQKLVKKREVWANVVPMRGGEYYEHLKISPEITYVIYTRFIPEITTDTLILYRDTLLEVRYPIDVEVKHVLLELHCVDKPKKEINAWI